MSYELKLALGMMAFMGALVAGIFGVMVACIYLGPLGLLALIPAAGFGMFVLAKSIEWACA